MSDTSGKGYRKPTGRYERVISKTGRPYYRLKSEFGGSKTRRSSTAYKYETVTAKRGKNIGRAYRRLKPEYVSKVVKTEGSSGPVRAATTSKTIAPRNIYTKGRSPAILGTGTQKVGASRGGGFKGGFPPRDTTGGAVKQSTQAEIKTMQKQMNADRNMNRAQAVSDAFDERFRALKRKLSGVQGNPGIHAFLGGGGGSKR